MIIHVDSDYKTDRVALSVKTGDDMHLMLVYHNEAGEVITPALKGVVFGAKRYEDYEGDFVLYLDDWASGQTADGDACMTGVLSLNSSLLAELLGERDVITLSAEINFLAPGLLLSSQTIALSVYNDIIKGGESLPPAPELPHYVTKSYVDAMIASITKGDDGATPEIGDNGNWWIGGVDTLVPVHTDTSHLATRQEMTDALSSKTETVRLSEDEYSLLPSPVPTNLYAITPNPA